MIEVYQETLDYLYSFVDYSLTKSNRYSAENFDLGRMHELVAKLGNPERCYPVIHIAGTKGKGSVAALSQSAFTCAGYRTGLYTSPHLHDYAERIKIDGRPISHNDLIQLVDEIKPVVETIPKLTTFEITTAVAFIHFARQKVDAAVFEVGLGGRLDATNVVLPIVSVITSLSYDHTHLLGDTLTQIAGEKAGIIKPGIPVVLAPQEEEARQVIEEISAERGSPLIQVNKDYLYAQLGRSLLDQTMMVWSADEQPLVDRYIEAGGLMEWEPTRLSIPLPGYHQIQNAATAYAALQTVNKNGLSVNVNAIQEGFSRTIWPGRFEILQSTPPVVIDAAHNRDSARKLRLTLDDYFPGRAAVLVFGASEDKDIEGMFAELMPRIDEVIATKSYHPRAIDPEKIVEVAHHYGRHAVIVSDVADALEKSLQNSAGEKLVLVTGSIFVVAGAREAWLARKGDPVAA